MFASIDTRKNPPLNGIKVRKKKSMTENDMMRKSYCLLERNCYFIVTVEKREVKMKSIEDVVKSVKNENEKG